MDEMDIFFQEAFGARLFRQGKPRAALEVKSVDTSAGSVTTVKPAMAARSLRRSPTAETPMSLRSSRRQLGQNVHVDLVVSKPLLVLAEAETAKRPCTKEIQRR
jgi:hypothetical protein